MSAPVFDLPEGFAVSLGANGVSISVPGEREGSWTTVLELRWKDDDDKARESIALPLYRQLRTFAALRDDDARTVHAAIVAAGNLRDRLDAALAILGGYSR